MNMNQIIPSKMRIDSIDDILYRIGLSFTSVKDRPKRHIIDHPLIVFIIVITFTIERLITVSISEENDLILKVLGDCGHFIGIREPLGTLFLLSTSFLLSLQLIYYYNYRNGIKPTFLRVFQMMSGLVSPKSLGLTDEQIVLKMIKTTKTLDKLIIVNSNFLIPFFATNFLMSFYIFFGQPYDAIKYGVLNALFFMIWGRIYWNLILYHFLFFYINSLYFKFKINLLNKRLIEMKRRKRFIRIRETLQSFDSLYSEINEYNTTFWSKYLGVFWLIFGSKITANLYMVIFLPLPLPIIVSISYALVLFILLFLFVIFTASSVNYCANKSYLILNSLFTTLYTQQNTRSNVLIKFKVIQNL